jgi:hypothetical protein
MRRTLFTIPSLSTRTDADDYSGALQLSENGLYATAAFFFVVIVARQSLLFKFYPILSLLEKGNDSTGLDSIRSLVSFSPYNASPFCSVSLKR